MNYLGKEREIQKYKIKRFFSFKPTPNESLCLFNVRTHKLNNVLH